MSYSSKIVGSIRGESGFRNQRDTQATNAFHRDYKPLLAGKFARLHKYESPYDSYNGKRA